MPSSQKVRCAVFSVSYLSRLVSCWMLRAVLNGGPSAAVSSGKQNTSCSGMRLFRLGSHGGAGFGVARVRRSLPTVLLLSRPPTFLPEKEATVQTKRFFTGFSAYRFSCLSVRPAFRVALMLVVPVFPGRNVPRGTLACTRLFKAGFWRVGESGLEQPVAWSEWM